MSASTWNHRIEPYVPPEIYPETCAVMRKKDELNGGCSSARSERCCGFAAVYRGRFNYVTGSRGRASERRVHFCARHAGSWAAGYQLQLPAPAVTQEQANANALAFKRRREAEAQSRAAAREGRP